QCTTEVVDIRPVVLRDSSKARFAVTAEIILFTAVGPHGYVVDVIVLLLSLVLSSVRVLFFFFQAEDGIRDATETGVQTCALPISREPLPLAVRPAGHWLGDAIRVIEPLERRLAARAEPALVDRRLRVALELDHPTLAHLGVQPAPSRAFAARGGVVGRRPRDLLLGGHDVRHEVFGRLGADAARGGRRGAAARRALGCG